LEVKTTTIYGLFDPREPAHIRYVGKTVNLKARINAHKGSASRGVKNHVYNWVRKLANDGVNFTYKVLEVIPAGGCWEDRERYWIYYYRELGHGLTNIADGGGGCSGFVLSEERKEQIKEFMSNRKLSDVHKRRIGAAHKGKSLDGSHRKKLSVSHKNSEKAKEHVYNLIKANKGRQLTTSIQSSTGYKYVYKDGRRFCVKIKFANHCKYGFETSIAAHEYVLEYLKNYNLEATQDAPKMS